MIKSDKFDNMSAGVFIAMAVGSLALMPVGVLLMVIGNAPTWAIGLAVIMLALFLCIGTTYFKLKNVILEG